MIGTAQHWSETMNALIAVIFVLLDTGMGQDAAIFLWVVLASVEWLANRYAGWLFKRTFLATPAIAPVLPAQSSRHLDSGAPAQGAELLNHLTIERRDHRLADSD